LNDSDRTVLITGDSIEVTSRFVHQEGSDDYTNNRVTLLKVKRARGKPLKPVWSAQWSEIAPGIETRCADGVQRIRIAAASCPIRIKHRFSAEYVSYSDPEYCRESRSEYWISYERSDDQNS
jgi:hypothetical protein